jgi:predicted transposase YbfD/YdcC
MEESPAGRRATENPVPPKGDGRVPRLMQVASAHTSPGRRWTRLGHRQALRDPCGVASSRSCPGRASPSSTPSPKPDTDAASPARSRPAGSPTDSAESPFPTPALLAIRVHRRRKRTGRRETRESVYAVTSLDAHQAGPADLATAIRAHWGIENSSHPIRDVTFAEDASSVHKGTAPRAMATLRNLAIGALKTLGADNIAKTTRAIRDEPRRALPILGIISDPDTNGT